MTEKWEREAGKEEKERKGGEGWRGEKGKLMRMPMDNRFLGMTSFITNFSIKIVGVLLDFEDFPNDFRDVSHKQTRE